MAPTRGEHPNSALAYCIAGDYGSQDDPRSLAQTNAHRRHRKNPRCIEPPMVQLEDGQWAQAGGSRHVRAQVLVAGQPLEPEYEAFEDDEPFSGGFAEQTPHTDPFAPPVTPAPGDAGGWSPPPPPPQPAMRYPVQPPEPPRVPAGTAYVSKPTGPPPAAPPPVLFGAPSGGALKFSPAVWELYAWAREHDYDGTPEELFEQAIRGYFLLRFRKAVGVVDVDVDDILRRLIAPGVAA